MLQLLRKGRDTIKLPQANRADHPADNLHYLSGEARTNLGEFILGLGLDAKARDVGVGEAGGVLQLFHPTDLTHGLVLLLLLLLRLRAWHLHFMLLVCGE